MKLKLENIGKIEKANIELKGITVIAGENNTGKSTVGKMLFCVFNAFYKIEEQIRVERQKTLGRVFTNYYLERTNRLKRRFSPLKLSINILDNQDMFINDKRKLIDVIRKFYLSADNQLVEYIDQDSLEQLAESVLKFLNIKDDEIRTVILRKRLEAEFGMKIGYLNNLDEKSRVCLEVKYNKIEFEVIRNESIIVSDYMSLIKEIMYIDDPFVLDNLNSVSSGYLNIFEHRGNLLSKIVNSNNAKEFSALDEVVTKQRLDKIFIAMEDVCDGELLSTDDGNAFVYKTDSLNGDLEIVNLSTGIKSFAILRTLLQNGSIDENGILILDEPEIHLHPEWQLKYAEIIVLIHKEFSTNILLNTHSPYFLNAIEVYSEKYGISDKCKYYLTNIDSKNRAAIDDVTKQRELIYEKLARPLQDLENLEYRNGNTIR